MAKQTAWKAVWVASTMVATLLVAVLVLNLGLGDQQVDAPIEHAYSIEDPLFAQTMGQALGADFVAGNRIDTLQNGEEIFPAMLEAIRSARHTVTLESYIFYSGQTARQFADALSERAHAGVRVHVLLDWFGGKIDDDVIERMVHSRVDVHFYHAPAWNRMQFMNNRTHRKILVVDGRVGFTGGVDIADKWRGDAQNPRHWRDTHYRVTGPAVGQLQAAFMDNWLQTTGRMLQGAHYFPEIAGQGSLAAQVFTSAPGGGSESMQLMYLLSIASATRSIHLASAYFVPGEVAVAQLAAAARRGVHVQIIVPGEHIDWGLVRRASRHRWGPLLEAGVEIYEYQPTMYHLKLLVADGIWTSVGSSNFDARSFAINDEANLNVYAKEFAGAQVAMFQQDLRDSERISLESWQGRPWWDKFLDALASLIGSQM